MLLSVSVAQSFFIVAINCMNIPLFIHSPVDGHLGYFQCEALMNEAATNILLQAF